jgi:hypothetical protein
MNAYRFKVFFATNPETLEDELNKFSDNYTQKVFKLTHVIDRDNVIHCIMTYQPKGYVNPYMDHEEAYESEKKTIHKIISMLDDGVDKHGKKKLKKSRDVFKENLD